MRGVTDCSRCGTPNPDGSRFCNNCGASLVTRVVVQERRVVTALFADLARSTSLGESLDPEVVRGLVGEFFDLSRREIERRGGAVEKFSGDAVMAVFGLPQAHEDDPERAVRAALAIRDGLATIAASAQERHGINVQARVGIESGEVVVGDPFGGATMATGDAMNLAARLEQQAEPGDVVIGAAAYDAVRDLVEAEPLGELELRGHDSTLRGWRVTAVATDVGRPRGVPGLQAPLTGRDEELAMLMDAARRASNEKKAVLFTILGVPGVGKSRLVRETADRLTSEGWSVVSGRCLPYGEGITYWAAAEMVRALGGVDADLGPEEAHARLDALAPDADVAQRLRMVIGAADDEQRGEGSDREIAWGFRRLVEHLGATRGPLMLVFEDIHWAEPPLLDLIEYVATWTRDAAVLVVCPSRPELMDTRPAWGAGKMEASRILLEPLTEEESRTLLGALLTVDDLPAELRQRVLDRAEGNPLFVEEVVRMLIEEGLVERSGDRWLARREAAEVRVPDSVEALIRARLDILPVSERAVLQAASVVGRVFQRSAVTALVPAGESGPTIERHLENAILRDLITEERAPDEPTFRFRHILIRDVAYATLPKARRAELHHAVADWLRAWAGERLDEFVEIEAYHLEQAVMLRRELQGTTDSVERDQAITALERSGQRALNRDDARAARAFAERALALDPPPGEHRMEIETLKMDALQRLGEFRLAGEIGARLEGEAAAVDRKDLQGRAILAKAGNLWVGLESANADAALSELRRARELLVEAGDARYLVDVLEMIGYGGWWHGHMEESSESWEEMRRIAHQNSWLSREAEALTLLSRIPLYTNDLETAGRLLDEAYELAVRGPSRLARAHVEKALAIRVEWSGSRGGGDANAEAFERLESAAAVFEEFGDRAEVNVALVHMGDIRRRQGRLEEALAYYERGLENVMDHAGYRPETGRRLAQVLVQLGQIERAAEIAEEAVSIVAPDDVFTVASSAMALGQVREAQGRLDEAEGLLRKAVEIVEATDYTPIEMHMALAAFLFRRGRMDEARRSAELALESARRLGPNSPVIRSMEEQIAAAEAEAAHPKT